MGMTSHFNSTTKPATLDYLETQQTHPLVPIFLFKGFLVSWVP